MHNLANRECLEKWWSRKSLKETPVPPFISSFRFVPTMKSASIGFAILLFVFCQLTDAAQPALWSSLTKLSNALKPLTTLCLSLEGTSTVYTTTTVTQTGTSVLPGAVITSTTTTGVVVAETDFLTTTQTVDQSTTTTTTSFTTTDIGPLSTSTTTITATETYAWDSYVREVKKVKRQLGPKRSRRERLQRRDVISSLFNLIASLDRTWLQAQCKQYIVKPATTTITLTATNSATTTTTAADVNTLVTAQTTSTSSTFTTITSTVTDVIVITDDTTATATTNDGTTVTTQQATQTIVLCQDGAENGTTYTASNGQKFTRYCDFNCPYSDIQVTYGVVNFDTCIEMCATYNANNNGGCAGVNYEGWRDNACWLKYYQSSAPGQGYYDAGYTSSAMVQGCDGVVNCPNEVVS
jgi:hypothetical protein